MRTCAALDSGLQSSLRSLPWHSIQMNLQQLALSRNYALVAPVASCHGTWLDLEQCTAPRAQPCCMYGANLPMRRSALVAVWRAFSVHLCPNLQYLLLNDHAIWSLGRLGSFWVVQLCTGQLPCISMHLHAGAYSAVRPLLPLIMLKCWMEAVSFAISILRGHCFSLTRLPCDKIISTCLMLTDY